MKNVHGETDTIGILSEKYTDDVKKHPDQNSGMMNWCAQSSTCDVYYGPPCIVMTDNGIEMQHIGNLENKAAFMNHLIFDFEYRGCHPKN